MLYVLAVMSTLLTRDVRLAVGVTMTSLVLIGLGVYVSPHAPNGVPLSYVLLNRLLAVVVITLVGLLTVRKLLLIIRLQSSNRELQQTSKLLQTASVLGKVGGWSADLASGRVEWSVEAARIHGALPADAPPLSHGVVRATPEFQATLCERLSRCLSLGEPFDEDLQILTAQGKARWVRLVGEAVTDNRGQIRAVQGALQDIHDRKTDQLALANSVARLRAFAESMPLSVWTANARGAFRYVSPYLCTYTGAEPKTLMGRGWISWVHPDDRDHVVSAWTRAVETQQPYEAEHRLLGKDGQYHWHISRAVFLQHDVCGRALWCGTSVDVQELKQLQTHSARLADRLSATMESVGDAIYTLDRDWRFVLLNQQAETLLQRNRADLLGQTVWAAFPQTVGTAIEQEYRRSMVDRVVVRFDMFYEPLGKHFEINAYPFSDGLTVYFRDVTGQRQMAEQLRQAQKLEALGQLTGGVAHDFNNLLTVMLGNADMLHQRAGQDLQQRALAQTIMDAAQSGAEMTRRLLAFARKQALAPQALDLNQLAQRLKPLLTRSLGSHIELEVSAAQDLWPTLVDPGQLESALLNLAINARDAMPHGGRLSIETVNLPASEGSPLASAGEYLDAVVLTVRDTGQGIPPEVLGHVFEPFFTTKPKGQGTGLGLAMVYGFVKQSGGHVDIASEPGQGTVVKIYLPRLLDAAQAVPWHAAQPVPEPVVSLGARILLVEDDSGVRDYAQEVLQHMGYSVVAAANGPEAIECLRQRNDIDLLFTDVMMPGGMSGAQLAEQARQLHPNLPVLFTSGYDESAVVHFGRLDAGVLLLPKPYRRAELMAKVHQALHPEAVA